MLERFEVGALNGGWFKRDLLYRLHIPLKAGEKTAVKFPLVVYLHSGASGGCDNKAQIEKGAETFADDALQAKHPCFVLAPQCPSRRQWLNTTFKKMPFTNYDQDAIPESHEMKMIVRLIHRLIRDYPVDPLRIYVTGFSMGGSGTWDIITRYPNLFAAAVPFSGVSDPHKPL